MVDDTQEAGNVRRTSSLHNPQKANGDKPSRSANRASTVSVAPVGAIGLTKRSSAKSSVTANGNAHVARSSVEFIPQLPDIKPVTAVSRLDRAQHSGSVCTFAIADVAAVVGLSATYIRKATGKRTNLNRDDVLALLDLDAFGETFVPRSKVLDYLLERQQRGIDGGSLQAEAGAVVLRRGHALDLLRELGTGSVQCVITSTPYWAMRIYKDALFVQWADGERCPYGHEQTPEGFIRHTAEVLYAISRVLSDDGSIWWNVMDSFNTRTQIRANAAEALRAMQGKDRRRWSQHDCRRYSAGHAYLKDGEQCLIPGRIAERASRMGLFVKTVITWAKTSTLPEPQESRVSRNLEYILHLSKTRTPRFNKAAYRTLPPELGGRCEHEADKLSDVWMLSTSSGRDGHGAQFPISLPARCIALSTSPGDVVLDPFVGAGNAGVAALALERRFIGFDVSQEYLAIAQDKLGPSVGPPPSGKKTAVSGKRKVRAANEGTLELQF